MSRTLLKLMLGAACGLAAGVVIGLMIRWLYLGETPAQTWAWFTTLFDG